MRGWHRALGSAALVFVAVLVLAPPLSISPVGRADAFAGAVTAAPESTPNGNVSITVPQPSITIVPGTYLVGQYRVAVISNVSGLPTPLILWVPQMLFQFQLYNLTVKSFSTPLTLNFSGPGPYATAPINVSTVARAGGPFNTSLPALMTSQLLSFMSNTPDGAVVLSVAWRWAVAFPDGSSVFGTWSSPQYVETARYAELVSYGPTSVPANGWFQVCMASTGMTREYSLHLETVNPVDDFVHVEQNVSGNATGPVCWSAQVASWVSPQPLIAHLWAYDQQSFLLYLIKLTVVNASGAWAFLGAWDSWNGAVSLGALAVAAGLIVWGTVHYVRARRKAPPDAEPPAAPPSPPA